MLDFADAVAINKFERRGAEDALREVRRQVAAQPRSSSASTPRRCPVFGTVAVPVQRRRRHRPLPAPPRPPAERRAAVVEGVLAPVRHEGRRPASTVLVPGDRTRYLAEIAEAVRSYHAHHRRAGRRGPRPSSSSTAVARPARRRRQATADVAELLDAARGDVAPATVDAARALRRRRRRGRRRRRRSRVAVGLARPAGRPAPHRRAGRAGALPPQREPAGPLPLHRRGVPDQARRRGPHPDVRRGGRAGEDQRPLPPASPPASPPPACRRRSTRSPSTAPTPTSGPTSTARSATPACRSRRSTT